MFAHNTPGCQCFECQHDREVHAVAESILEHMEGKRVTQAYVLAACIRVVAFIAMRGKIYGSREEGIKAVFGLLTDEINFYRQMTN